MALRSVANATRLGDKKDARSLLADAAEEKVMQADLELKAAMSALEVLEKHAAVKAAAAAKKADPPPGR